MTVSNRENTMMADQDLVRDCLDTLKHLSSCYTHAAIECDSQDLRGVFRNILNDKLELQMAAFQFMNQRGWYKTTPADRQEVSKVYNGFQQQYQEVMSAYQQ